MPHLSLKPQVIIHIDHSGGAGHTGVAVAADGDLGGGHAAGEGLLVQRELPGSVHVVGLLEGLVLIARDLRGLGRGVGGRVGDPGLHSPAVNIHELAVLKLGGEPVSTVS